MEVCWYAYWVVAFAVSLYWGGQGYMYINYDCSNKNAKCTIYNDTTFKTCSNCDLYGQNESNRKWIKWSYAVSDFFSSMIGFTALFVLFNIFPKTSSDFKDMSAFLIFLGIVAILGITGFGYRFVDVFKKKS